MGFNVRLMNIREHAIYIIRICILNITEDIHIPDIGMIEEKTRFLSLDSKDCNLVKQFNLPLCITNSTNTEVDDYIKNFVDAVYDVCSSITDDSHCLFPNDVNFFFVILCCTLLGLVIIPLNIFFYLTLKKWKKYKVCESNKC